LHEQVGDHEVVEHADDDMAGLFEVEKREGEVKDKGPDSGPDEEPESATQHPGSVFPFSLIHALSFHIKLSMHRGSVKQDQPKNDIIGLIKIT